MNTEKCLFIAHRGESHEAPENTLAAINLAWQRNADAVEIDIHLSKDNQIVVIHDSNTKRTGKRNKKVKDQTLSELKELDVGSFKGEKWVRENIPTLTEVFSTVPSNKKLLIEIKCGSEILPFLKTEINNSGLEKKQIEIIGFNYDTVIKTKMLLPDHKAFWIHKLDYTLINKIFKPSLDLIIKRAVDKRLDGLDLWAGNMINKEVVEKMKCLGLKLYVWTVNDPEEANELINLGIDGIITDRVSWLKQKTGQL